MRTTEIRVSYGRTHNLGNYSNIRPEVQIIAVLDEDDTPTYVRAQLLAEARAFVHAAIDDALEVDGQPARFSPEPRYRVMKRHTRDRWKLPAGHQDEEFTPTVVILPDGAEQPEGYTGCFGPDGGDWRRHRYAYARAIAQWYAGEAGALIIDCSDGDLSKIPPAQTVPIPVLVPVADPYDLAADEGDDDDGEGR